VQLHDLPLGDMNLCSACEIGKIIGEVQSRFKEWGSQDGSSYMRIRVRVDTSKPLCRGRKICLEDGKVSWVRFKYERLPNLSYWCGLFTHSDKDCDLWVRSCKSLTENDQQFGGWLRAPATLPKKCSVVKVEGCDREEVREKRPPIVVHDSDNRVRNEVDDHGLCRFDVVRIGLDQSECVLVDGMDTSEHLGAKLSSHNVDFQEILNEINMGLSKFDDQDTSDPPLRTLTGLALSF